MSKGVTLEPKELKILRSVSPESKVGTIDMLRGREINAREIKELKMGYGNSLLRLKNGFTSDLIYSTFGVFAILGLACALSPQDYKELVHIPPSQIPAVIAFSAMCLGTVGVFVNSMVKEARIGNLMDKLSIRT